MSVFKPRQMLVRSVPILSALILIEMIGGSTLGSRYAAIMPIFLILLPPFLAVGGNVGSVFGSRVSSALHLGLITPSLRKNGALTSNVTALAVSGLASFTCLGFFVYIASSTLGISDLGLIRFMAITLLSGSCLTFLTIGLSLLICFASYRRGLDPDDVVVPVVTTVTDLLGIVLLLTFIASLGVP